VVADAGAFGEVASPEEGLFADEHEEEPGVDGNREPGEAGEISVLLELDRTNEEKNVITKKEPTEQVWYYRGEVTEGLPHGQGNMVLISPEELENPPQKSDFYPLPGNLSCAGVWNKGYFSGEVKISSKVELYYIDGMVAGFSFSSGNHLVKCYLDAAQFLDMPYDWDGDIGAVTVDRLNGFVHLHSEHFPAPVFLPLVDGFLYDSRLKLHWTGANFYRGDLVDKKMTGTGRKCLSIGYYEGEWLNDKKHGLGIETYDTEERKEAHIGEFKDNVKQGSGIMKVTFKDKVFKLVSTWEAGYPRGDSVFEAPNNVQYRGRLNGTILLGDGFSYDCNFPHFDHYGLVVLGKTNNLNEPIGFTTINSFNYREGEEKELHCFWPENWREYVIVDNYLLGNGHYTGAIKGSFELHAFAPSNLLIDQQTHLRQGLGILVEIETGVVSQGIWEEDELKYPLNLSGLTYENLVDLHCLFEEMSKSLDLELI
jgi:hypothetical protein